MTQAASLPGQKIYSLFYNVRKGSFVFRDLATVVSLQYAK